MDFRSIKEDPVFIIIFNNLQLTIIEDLMVYCCLSFIKYQINVLNLNNRAVTETRIIF